MLATEKNTEDFGSYNLEWLFDPSRIDHLPVSEQLKHYATRDLRYGKLYNIGQRLFGEMPTRTRIIQAIPGDHVNISEASASPLVSDTCLSIDDKDPSKLQLALKTQASSMQTWVKERKTFRQRFDAMGLNEFLLQHKADRTSMEQNVLNRMKAERKHKTTPPPPIEEELPLDAVLPTETPLIKRPSPLAIKIIEDHLRTKHIRLIDMFASVDKQKRWLISREDFRKALDEANLPISETLLEDLMSTLDKDFNNLLDYRELAEGMGLWSAEKRNTKKKLIEDVVSKKTPSRLYSAVSSGLQSPSSRLISPMSSQKSVATPLSPSTRVKSAASVMSRPSSSSSSQLQLPKPDNRPEQLILSSEEAMVDLRKHDREALPRNLAQKRRRLKHGDAQPPSVHSRPGGGFIKTGDPLQDKHLLLSTIGCDMNAAADMVRQQASKEYQKIIKLCQQRGVVLTEPLLRRAMLYPPELPHRTLLKKLQDPHYKYLLSRNPKDPCHISHLSILVPGLQMPVQQKPSKMKKKGRKQPPPELIVVAEEEEEEDSVSSADVTSAVSEDGSFDHGPSPSTDFLFTTPAAERKQQEEGLPTVTSIPEETLEELPKPTTLKEVVQRTIVIRAKRENRMPTIPIRRSLKKIAEPSVKSTESPVESAEPSTFPGKWELDKSPTIDPGKISATSSKVSLKSTLRLQIQKRFPDRRQAHSYIETQKEQARRRSRKSGSYLSSRDTTKGSRSASSDSSGSDEMREIERKRKTTTKRSLRKKETGEKGGHRKIYYTSDTKEAGEKGGHRKIYYTSDTKERHKRDLSETRDSSRRTKYGTHGRDSHRQPNPYRRNAVLYIPPTFHVMTRQERKLAKLKKYGNPHMAQYPHEAEKKKEPVEMELSTGKALISRKVDCWVTFEQFHKFVNEIPGDYVHLYGPSQQKTFWPGRVLERLRLCLDDWSPHSSSHPIFEHVTRSKLKPMLTGIPRCKPVRPSLIQY